MQVCRFNNASCGTFEALTQTGYLYTTVENVGTLSATYQLTVSARLPLLNAPAQEASGPVLQFRVHIVTQGCPACHLFSCVQVASCSSTVMPILAQDLALAPNQTQQSSFQVYVESAAAANLSCVVTLLDSQASPSTSAGKDEGGQHLSILLWWSALRYCRWT